MISFQNFSFRYEESKDFTLRGIDMTVQDVYKRQVGAGAGASDHRG